MARSLGRASSAGATVVVALVVAAACGGGDDDRGGSSSVPGSRADPDPAPRLVAPASSAELCDLVAEADLAAAFGVAEVPPGRADDAFDVPTCAVDVPLADRTMAVNVAVANADGECGDGPGAFSCEVDRASEVLAADAEAVDGLGDVAAWVQPADTPLTSATLVVRQDLVVLQLSASGLERTHAVAAARALIAARSD